MYPDSEPHRPPTSPSGAGTAAPVSHLQITQAAGLSTGQLRRRGQVALRAVHAAEGDQTVAATRGPFAGVSPGGTTTAVLHPRTRAPHPATPHPATPCHTPGPPAPRPRAPQHRGTAAPGTRYPAPTTIHRTAAIRSHCARRRRQPKNSHREAVTFRGAEHRSTSPRRSGRAAGSVRRRRRPKGQSPRSGVLSRLSVREGSAAGDADFCVGEVRRQAVGVVEPALWEDDVVAGAALAAAGGAEFGDRERDVAVELLQQLVQPGE